MLYGNLEGWDGVGGGRWEGVSGGRGHMYTYDSCCCVAETNTILLSNYPPIKNKYRDFPGGPVAKTLSSQCRGPRFDPWSGS